MKNSLKKRDRKACHLTDEINCPCAAETYSPTPYFRDCTISSSLPSCCSCKSFLFAGNANVANISSPWLSPEWFYVNQTVWWIHAWRHPKWVLAARNLFRGVCGGIHTIFEDVTVPSRSPVRLPSSSMWSWCCTPPFPHDCSKCWRRLLLCSIQLRSLS